MNQNNQTPEEINNDITSEERELLDESMLNSLSRDNDNLKRAALDTVDDDSDPVNEGTGNLTGEDLDVPGSVPIAIGIDNAMEEIGEEDEENNGYSRADT